MLGFTVIAVSVIASLLGRANENQEKVRIVSLGFQSIGTSHFETLDSAFTLAGYTLPLATPTPEVVIIEATPIPAPVIVFTSEVTDGFATHYGGGPAWGDSVDYNGRPLGCGGIYRSENPTIAAVSPLMYGEWPCGTQLELCGPVGCVVVTRQDACPGCAANVIDLSESAHQQVCGIGTCRITIRQR